MWQILHAWNVSKKVEENSFFSPAICNSLRRICDCSETFIHWISTKNPFCNLFVNWMSAFMILQSLKRSYKTRVPIYCSRTYLYYSPVPSIFIEDVILPSPFLRRQAVLTKGNFACVSLFFNVRNRVIHTVSSQDFCSFCFLSFFLAKIMQFFFFCEIASYTSRLLWFDNFFSNLVLIIDFLWL